MTDMLVKLYQLSPLEPHLSTQATHGITVRRALAPERLLIAEWVKTNFALLWASECEMTFAQHPISCFIALKDGELLGFACYDATQRGFFGPMGVSESTRGLGTGAALLMACLHDMRQQSYGYAIIGGVGPIPFYEKVCGAVVIPDSTPGVYAGMLRPQS